MLTRATTSDCVMPTLDLPSLQKLIQPMLPGLLGVRLTEATPERVRAELTVRADLCTAGHILHGGSYMAFADTLGGGHGAEPAARPEDRDHGLQHPFHRRRARGHGGER